VVGFVTPADIPVTITDTPVTETGTYVPMLTVLIEPATAITAGAQWSLTVGPPGFDPNWHDGGDSIPAPPGGYTIVFRGATGFVSPSAIAVTITDTPDTETGTYIPSLVVYIEPQDAIDDGALWGLSAGPPGFDTSWHTSGQFISAPPGSYNITFKALLDWITPLDIAVTITDTPDTETGIYVPIPQ
jgi:hypothetical protein